MKYKVFLDSNQVFSNKGPLNEVFNLSITELRRFLDENDLVDVEICLPEIVIRERVQQKLEQIEESIERANQIIEALYSLQHKDKKVIAKKDYRKILEKNIKAFLTQNQVTRIKPPSIAKEDLIDRAINKMRPFNDNGAGFKDTLIYLSLVEDALQMDAADKYIFCTNDSKEFTDDVAVEFKEKTGKELYILNHISNVSEKLDELIPLHLHLTERNKKLQNLILSNIGDIMVEINKQRSRTRPYNAFARATVETDFIFNQSSPYASVFNANENKKEIVGYNFETISFTNFNELSDGFFSVVANVRVEIKYKEDDDASNPYSVNYRSVFVVPGTQAVRGFVPANKDFEVEIKCSLKDETVVIISVWSPGTRFF